MRVVALVGDQPNQKALCNKLASVCELVGIVRSHNLPLKPKSHPRSISSLAGRIATRILAPELASIWQKMQRQYESRFPHYPAVRTIEISGVNYPETLALLGELKPDLIVVSGTNMVGPAIIQWGNQNTEGVMNLHTGISPYVRGGPNCTNWCLALGWYHLIGNTVMWIDSGVDSGDLIATEQTPLDGSESLFNLHWKVMEHGHELTCRAISLAASGASLPRVKQRLDLGRCFKNDEWKALQARKALRNFKSGYSAGIRNRKDHVDLVRLT